MWFFSQSFFAIRWLAARAERPVCRHRLLLRVASGKLATVFADSDAVLRIRHAVLLPSLFLAAHVAGATERSEADMWVLCRENALFDFYRPAPPFTGVREDVPADLVADRFDVSNRTQYVLEGGVEITRADQRIAADRLTYDTQAETYDAQGNVQYQDSGLLLGAERARGALARFALQSPVSWFASRGQSPCIG